MRFKLVHVSRRLPWPWWAGAVVAMWLALGGVVTYVSGCMGRKVVLCFFKRLTGIPCPTCGFSRALLCILRGDIVGVWWHNPLVFSILAVFLAVMLMRLVVGRKIQIHLTRAERFAAWVATGVLVLINWAYIILYVG